MVIKRNTFQVQENYRKLKITNVDKDTIKWTKQNQCFQQILAKKPEIEEKKFFGAILRLSVYFVTL